MDVLRYAGFLLCDGHSFLNSPCARWLKTALRKSVVCREAKQIVDRINAFSYAVNVRYASLSIMFLTACKLCNFLASRAVNFKNFLGLALVLMVSAWGAVLSELNVYSTAKSPCNLGRFAA